MAVVDAGLDTLARVEKVVPGVVRDPEPIVTVVEPLVTVLAGMSHVPVMINLGGFVYPGGNLAVRGSQDPVICV